MKIRKNLLLFIFIIYLGLLLYLTIFFNMRRNISMTYIEYLKSAFNIIPFINLIQAINSGSLVSFFINTFSVLLLYLPLGIIIPLLLENSKYKKVILVSLLVIIIIEILQLLTTLGIFDINDIIVGFIGVSLGYLINKALKKKAIF